MPFIAQAYLDWLRAPERETLLRDHTSLGWHPQTRDALLVPEVDEYSGKYITGVQGVGKSGLLENLIAQDAAKGRSIIVLDPHGDLITHVIQQLPASRLQQTYLLDIEDESYPYGVNALAHGKLTTDVERTQAIERLMHIFEVLWPDVLSQQNLPLYVRMATIVLLDNPGATLVDMLTFLEDSAFRTRLLSRVKDPSVVRFWQQRYEDVAEDDRARRVQPLTNRLTSLFVGRSLVRNIVGQHKTSIRFRKAIENREIILIRLPIKTLKQDARLIGTVLLTQLHAALFSFADIPEAQRPGFSLVVDECQHFVSGDFAELFTEGRKFGVRLVLAHQYRAQLPDFLQQSTMTARTKICFQVTPEDAREMAHLFPVTETFVRPEDIDLHVTETLLTRASDYGAVVERFVDCFLQSLQRYRSGRSKVAIRNGGFDGRAMVSGLMSGQSTHVDIMVDDPTPFLDRLLYNVMRTGNWQVPIPYEIPRGFANSGNGFFAAARGAKEWELGPEMMDRFPAHLVVRTGDGDLQWTREPENGKETFYFFLYCLRSLMHQLAQQPIGKETSTKPVDVARMLANLPKRAAFVRAGETVGVIYTNDTKQGVVPEMLQTRIATIQAQTRLTYCHPREDIEQAILNDEAIPAVASPSNPAVRMSRWEQL